mgnify:CR=1 FL=1
MEQPDLPNLKKGWWQQQNILGMAFICVPQIVNNFTKQLF